MLDRVELFKWKILQNGQPYAQDSVSYVQGYGLVCSMCVTNGNWWQAVRSMLYALGGQCDNINRECGFQDPMLMTLDASEVPPELLQWAKEYVAEKDPNAKELILGHTTPIFQRELEKHGYIYYPGEFQYRQVVLEQQYSEVP